MNNFSKNDTFSQFSYQSKIHFMLTCLIASKDGYGLSLEDIFDYTKWQADHIVSFDKGGRTTIENGQLICAVANLQKSNN